MATIAYISLGSNTGNLCANLNLALRELSSLKDAHCLACSPFFHTEPQNRRDQPWFANAAAMFHLEQYWNAGLFLEKMQEIELKLGRRREREMRFGPRTIDLDLIMFGAEKSADPFCILPHPRASERAFVLLPLLTIAPSLHINFKSLKECLSLLNWRLRGFSLWQEEKAQNIGKDSPFQEPLKIGAGR